jgi:hypothetical protein
VAETQVTQFFVRPIGIEVKPKVIYDSFSLPVTLRPPSVKSEYWKSNIGFHLAGPPGHPDDRFEVADVVRDKRKVTVTIEYWRTGKKIEKADARRPTQIVGTLPLLDVGDYDLTVKWKQYTPHLAETPYWFLELEKQAETKFTVYSEGPPAEAKLTTLSTKDFIDVAVEKAESARRWIPVPNVRYDWNFGGFGKMLSGRIWIGVEAGTFDPDTWLKYVHSAPPAAIEWYAAGNKEPYDFKKHTEWHLATRFAAPVRPAKPTDPLYVVIYPPQEANDDHYKVRSIEWRDGGFQLSVQYFHTGFVNGSNAATNAVYIVKLPCPEADVGGGRKTLTGKIPVTVNWSVLHGKRTHGTEAAAFKPLEKDECVFGTFSIPTKATADHPRPEWMDTGIRTSLVIVP